MSNAPETTNTTTSNSQDEIPKDLIELALEIAKTDPATREKLDPILNKVVENSRRRRRIYTLVQEALSQLRLDMKYLMFDLEATRRERDELKSGLDNEE